MLRHLPIAVAAMLFATAAGAQEPGVRSQWTTGVEGGGRYLTLAQPDAEEVDLQLRCPARGATSVSFRVWGIHGGDGPTPRRVTIASGATRATVPVTFRPDEMTADGYDGSLPLSSPVLATFARSGRFSISAGQAAVGGAAATRAERAAVARFFTGCRGGR